MVEINLNGFVYVFENDWKLIDWLEANADSVREVHRFESMGVNRDSQSRDGI